MHDLAERLEHIDSADLIDRLESFLGHPPFDPHGDSIPDRAGRIKANITLPLATALPHKRYEVVSLAETDDAFLKYLGTIRLRPGSRLRISALNEYDGSLTVTIGRRSRLITERLAKNILVKPVG